METERSQDVLKNAFALDIADKPAHYVDQGGVVISSVLSRLS